MKFKKILLTLIISFSLNAYSSYSGVYFCSDTKTTGFEPKENFKVYSFKGKKFKAKIDFEKKDLISKELYFDDIAPRTCSVNDNSTIKCHRTYGSSFTFNPETGYFVRSQFFLGKNKLNDSIYIAYGTCEKF